MNVAPIREHVARRRTSWYIGATALIAGILQVAVGGDLHRIFWG